MVIQKVALLPHVDHYGSGTVQYYVEGHSIDFLAVGNNKIKKLKKLTDFTVGYYGTVLYRTCFFFARALGECSNVW